MKHIIAQYNKAFEAFGDSPQAVLWGKGNQDIRFNALISHFHLEKVHTLVDFGCGLAHLYPFLKNKGYNERYIGVDIVQNFLAQSKQKYPTEIFKESDEFLSDNQTYDLIISSGAFSLLYYTSIKKHQEYVFYVIERLFEKCRIGISINFMTSFVDYKQENAYHQDPFELCNFLSTSLTRRFILDQSYMPYEFTISLFKNETIISNMYEKL